MELFSTSIFLCIIAGLGSMWYYLTGRKLPPGPVDVFGKIFKLDDRATAAYILSFKEKYGPVSCIRVLGRPCIYLNTYEKIRQCMITYGDLTSGRLNFSDEKVRWTAGRGLVINDGESWLVHRRFTLSTLRDFGFGKLGSEQLLQNELAQMITEFAKCTEAVDPRLSLNVAICNVICWLVFGERCGNEPGIKPIYNVVQDTAEGNYTSRHEIIRYYLLKLYVKLPTIVWTKVMKNFDAIFDYLDEKVEAHKRKFNGEVHDLIDAYLHEIQAQNESNGKEHFDEKNLLRSILDLFVAGMETTTSTMRWSLFLMARYPSVQQRVQAELDEVLQGRMPSTADRKRLPYVDAVIMEIQRYSTFAPLGAVVHRVTEEFELDGYTIPKDALMYPNLFAAHRDTSVWPHPFEFNPDNFYDAATKSTRNADQLIPFGVGRRSCLGESLAKQELFVLFSGLVQAFELRPASGERFPTEDECRFARVRVCPAYKLSMKLRSALDSVAVSAD